MSNLTNRLNLIDRVNLELIKRSLKPATYITFGGFKYPEAYDITMEGVYVISTKGREGIIPILEEVVHAFETELITLCLSQRSHGTQTTYLRDSKNPTEILLETVDYLVANDSEALKKLQCAESDSAIGLALGYPQEDVEAYQQTIGNQIRDGRYYTKMLGNAVKAGVEIPTWLAYISQVPKELDLIRGRVSQGAEKLGLTYQSYIKDNVPQLAIEIEQEFARRCSPNQPDSFMHYAD